MQLATPAQDAAKALKAEYEATRETAMDVYRADRAKYTVSELRQILTGRNAAVPVGKGELVEAAAKGDFQRDYADLIKRWQDLNVRAYAEKRVLAEVNTDRVAEANALIEQAMADNSAHRHNAYRVIEAAAKRAYVLVLDNLWAAVKAEAIRTGVSPLEALQTSLGKATTALLATGTGSSLSRSTSVASNLAEDMQRDALLSSSAPLTNCSRHERACLRCVLAAWCRRCHPSRRRNLRLLRPARGQQHRQLRRAVDRVGRHGPAARGARVPGPPARPADRPRRPAVVRRYPLRPVPRSGGRVSARRDDPRTGYKLPVWRLLPARTGRGGRWRHARKLVQPVIAPTVWVDEYTLTLADGSVVTVVAPLHSPLEDVIAAVGPEPPAPVVAVASLASGSWSP